MVIIITGATHTGKTLLAQKLLEKYHYPYLSIDHIKMGLIRSGHTSLTPSDDKELEAFLWPIVREMIKTAVENGQNLIIEGGYIPPDWKDAFDAAYSREIRFICLVMSRGYIEKNFSRIQQYENVIEQRIEDGSCTRAYLIEENARYKDMCDTYGYPYVWIEDEYRLPVTL